MNIQQGLFLFFLLNSILFVHTMQISLNNLQKHKASKPDFIFNIHAQNLITKRELSDVFFVSKWKIPIEDLLSQLGGPLP